MFRKLPVFLVVSLVLAACATTASAGPQIHVEGAWARPADVGSMGEPGATPDMQNMPGMSGSGVNSAAYFVIVNDGNEADTLIGVSSEVANSTEMHETRIENDVAQMFPVVSLDIPAHGNVEFKPSGYHVMLVGLTQDLKEGDSIKITLHFDKSGSITLDVRIRQQ